MKELGIVIPNLNQGPFLRTALESIFGDEASLVQVVVVDGGSTDESLSVIEEFADRLHWWESRPDNGQVDAINKGLGRLTSRFVAWQNADDFYLPDGIPLALRAACSSIAPDVIMGNLALSDIHGRIAREVRYTVPCVREMLAEGMLLASQSLFWKRELLDRIGYPSPRWTCSFDYDYFLRLSAAGLRFKHVGSCIGAFRLHDSQKSATVSSAFADENERIRASWAPARIPSVMFRAKRALRLCIQGDAGYVVRGLVDRMRGGDRSPTPQS